MAHHFYRTFETNAASNGRQRPLLIDRWHAPQLDALIEKLKRLDKNVASTASLLNKYHGEALIPDHDNLDNFNFIRDRYKRKGVICISAWADRVYSGAITLDDIYRNYGIHDDILGVPLRDVWEASKHTEINPIGYHLLGIPMDQWKFWSHRPEIEGHPYYISWYNSAMTSYGLEPFTASEYEALYSAALEFRLVTDQSGGAAYYVGRSESQGKLPKTLLNTYAARAQLIQNEKGYHRWNIKDFARMICDDWSVDAIARFHNQGADHEEVQRLYNMGIHDAKTIVDVLSGNLPEEWARAASQL